jgi:hypothetical protein
MLLTQVPSDGVWQGYDGEWKHVSQQLVALAEATAADKFAWRPAPGIRSTSEVYMHIVDANFYLLSLPVQQQLVREFPLLRKRVGQRLKARRLSQSRRASVTSQRQVWRGSEQRLERDGRR